MRFLEKISQKYYSKVSDIQDVEEVRKFFQLSVTAWLTLILYLVFGLLSLADNLNFLYSSVLVFGALMSAFILIYIRKIKRKSVAAWILLITLGATLIFLLVTGGVNGSGLLWLLAIPVIVNSFFGYRTGGLISLLFLVIALFVFISRSFIDYPFEYNNSLIIRFISIYFFISVISVFFGFEREIFENSQEKNLLETKKESKRKDDFLSVLSHQIRTPLNNLTMVSNLIDRDKLDAEQLDLIDTIIASTNNLINVVDNIVKVSKIDFDKESGNRISFDLYSTIDNTLKLFRNQYKDEVILDLIISEQIMYNVIGDPIRLKQIFLNLVGNILKVSDFPVNIGIDVRENKKNENHVQLAFSVRCPVFRIQKSHDIPGVKKITELPADENPDFSIAKRIIEHHNSKLDFETGSKYSEFSFLLDFEMDNSKIESFKPEVKVEEPVVFAPVKKINLEDANVLLVEDNAINQKIVILSLKNHVKNIDIAFNGKEALDKFGKSRYDLILMDIQMPVMNGIVATKKIRELEAATHTHIPIIAITANALSGDKETCLAAGMNDYISKPFQIDTLIAKMKNLVG